MTIEDLAAEFTPMPKGFRTIGDNEVVVKGDMCCLVGQGNQWTVIDSQECLGMTGEAAKKKWANYMFATPRQSPIFNTRILPPDKIEELCDPWPEVHESYYGVEISRGEAAILYYDAEKRQLKIEILVSY
jgi:hypothetical protein